MDHAARYIELGSAKISLWKISSSRIIHRISMVYVEHIVTIEPVHSFPQTFYFYFAKLLLSFQFLLKMCRCVLWEKVGSFVVMNIVKNLTRLHLMLDSVKKISRSLAKSYKSHIKELLLKLV